MGTPPRTAFDPSRLALELRKRFSLPLADFHEITVAPYNKISTRSPVGKLAVTRELSSEMETRGVGWMGETGIAAGFLARSILEEQRELAWKGALTMTCTNKEE